MTAADSRPAVLGAPAARSRSPAAAHSQQHGAHPGGDRVRAGDRIDRSLTVLGSALQMHQLGNEELLSLLIS